MSGNGPPETTKQNGNAKDEIPNSERGLALRSLKEMYRFAQWVIGAEMAPSTLDTPEKVVIAMQLGRELGLPYMVSLKSIAVVHGTPTLYGDAALGLVRRSGLLESILETFEGEINGDLAQTPDDVRAVCTVKRKGDAEAATRTFSVGDARLAGLWMRTGYKGGKTPWWFHPKRMMQYKARAFALRDTFPDVLLGIHFYEEMVGEDRAYVDSTDVTCKSQQLLDGGQNGKGDDGRAVQEPGQEDGQPARLQGRPDGERGDLRTGGVDQEERAGGDVHEPEPTPQDERPHAKGDGGKLFICLDCLAYFDPEDTTMAPGKGQRWQCPECGSTNYDAAADRQKAAQIAVPQAATDAPADSTDPVGTAGEGGTEAAAPADKDGLFDAA